MRFRILSAIVLAFSSVARAQDANHSPTEEPAPSISTPAASATSTTPDTSQTTTALGGEAQQYGLLGPVRVGLSWAVEVPHVLNTSIDAIWERTIGASFSWGGYHFETDKAEMEIRNWDVRLRWFPWQGSFFLGGMFGKQNLAAKTKQDTKLTFQDTQLTIPTQAKVTVDTTYITPHIGWFANWDWGLVLGFELGYQIPLSSDSELQVGFENTPASLEAEVKATAEYKKVEKDATDLADQIGETALPYFALLRIGFML